jgi:hypothetical protein
MITVLTLVIATALTMSARARANGFRIERLVTTSQTATAPVP